ncbi:hypothetical protein Nmel_015374 [Mimus melanotis]
MISLYPFPSSPSPVPLSRSFSQRTHEQAGKAYFRAGVKQDLPVLHILLNLVGKKHFVPCNG